MRISKCLKKITAALLVISMFMTGCSNTNNATTNNENKTITIYFARHGKTMLNTVDRSQGWIDAPLTPVGVEGAENLGKGLATSEIKFDKVYSSDSGRAIETAELILANQGQSDLAINKDKRLREYNFGTYEGMPNEEMQEAMATSIGMTLEEFVAYMQENGFVASCELFADALAALDKEKVEDGVNWPAEDYQTIVNRLTESLDEIIADAVENGYDSILVVSHGMSISTLLYELDNSAEIPATGLKNSSISVVEYQDGTYKVVTVNDLSYLEAGEGK